MKHPITKAQIEVGLLLLAKLAENENSIKNVAVYGSDYSSAIYIKYQKIEIGEDAGIADKLIEIETDGTIDENIRINKQFSSLADRVHYFSSLYPIKIV